MSVSPLTRKYGSKWNVVRDKVRNGDGYDALKDAEAKWRQNPDKYNSESRYYSNKTTIRSDNRGRTYTEHKGHVRRKITLVVEHTSGCKGESVSDDIRMGIEDNFPDVKFVEISGRFDSFEVFINGRLLFSRISQGGYPYTEEVLDAVMRAREGREFRELDSGSSMCTIL